MDSTLSTTEAARALNTTLPRVHRSLLATRHWDVRRSSAEADLWRLQTLTSRPRLRPRSRRYRARRAARSRSTSSTLARLAICSCSGPSRRSQPDNRLAALARLGNKGYVVHPLRRVVEGTVKEVELWEINWSAPVWRSVESDVRRAVLPARVAADHASSSPPKYLDHLFWNVDRPSLNLDSDGAFIALRVLGSLDLQGLSWLASGAISKENLRHTSRACGISPRQKDFALNLARQM